MSSNDLIYMSAADIADKIKEKQISPVEVVNAYLDRIEAVDDKTFENWLASKKGNTNLANR